MNSDIKLAIILLVIMLIAIVLPCIFLICSFVSNSHSYGCSNKHCTRIQEEPVIPERYVLAFDCNQPTHRASPEVCDGLTAPSVSKRSG